MVRQAHHGEQKCHPELVEGFPHPNPLPSKEREFRRKVGGQVLNYKILIIADDA
jgi:hypothetical protein